MHNKNICTKGEWDKTRTVANFATVQNEYERREKRE